MSGYSAALECQCAMIRHWGSWLGSEHVRQIVEQQRSWGLEQTSETELVRKLRGNLLQAETFFLSRDCVAAIREASLRMPPHSLAPVDLPVPAGWVYFESPLDLSALDTRAYLSGGLRAFSWEPPTTRPFPDMRGERPTDGPKVWVSAYFDAPTPPYLVLSSSVLWPFGDSWDGWSSKTNPDNVANRAASALSEALRAFVLCFWLFVQQEVVTSVRQTVDRAVRKRVQRETTVSPVVRVVQLRRTASVVTTAVGSEPGNWSCRWMVRGHWRQQPCGRRHAERRATWVHPHVKGPDSQPLKPPRATVFAVVR